MQILIIRHAIAEDRDVFARTQQDDDLRPLTAKGRQRMQRGAHGLARLTGVDLLGHSPLTRAVQTAGILGEVFSGCQTLEIPELSPGRGPETVASWLGFVSRQARVALVGHEPDLGELIAWLTTGVPRPFIKLKKGGAVMLECPERPDPGSATLHWVLTPQQLRLLAPET
jgi:phosphohistidine phosphatase